MSSLHQLQDRFYKALGGALSENNFKPLKSRQSFHRQNERGWDSIHVAFIRHPPTDFDLTVDIAVRIDAVEELVLMDNNLLTRSQKKQSATFGIELGNLTQGSQRRWNISNEYDIGPAVGSIRELLNAVALPYFEKFRDLDQVLALLSSNERPSTLHAPFHDMRCMRAIALAFLMGKSSELEPMISRNREFLQNHNELAQRTFNEFAAKIRRLAASGSDCS